MYIFYKKYSSLNQPVAVCQILTKVVIQLVTAPFLLSVELKLFFKKAIKAAKVCSFNRSNSDKKIYLNQTKYFKNILTMNKSSVGLLT